MRPSEGVLYASVSQAMAVAQQLRDADQLVEISAVTDPDGLLGLPGMYASKVGYFDVALNVNGYVEVFPTSLDRDSRSSTLNRTRETDFELGTVLVRVLTTNLSLAQTAKYDAAVNNLVLP